VRAERRSKCYETERFYERCAPESKFTAVASTQKAFNHPKAVIVDNPPLLSRRRNHLSLCKLTITYQLSRILPNSRLTVCFGCCIRGERSRRAHKSEYWSEGHNILRKRPLRAELLPRGQKASVTCLRHVTRVLRSCEPKDAANVMRPSDFMSVVRPHRSSPPLLPILSYIPTPHAEITSPSSANLRITSNSCKHGYFHTPTESRR
jgi:hypothetical protein